MATSNVSYVGIVIREGCTDGLQGKMPLRCVRPPSPASLLGWPSLVVLSGDFSVTCLDTSSYGNVSHFLLGGALVQDFVRANQVGWTALDNAKDGVTFVVGMLNCAFACKPISRV